MRQTPPNVCVVEKAESDASREQLMDFIRTLAREAARADHDAQMRNAPAL